MPSDRLSKISRVRLKGEGRLSVEQYMNTLTKQLLLPVYIPTTFLSFGQGLMIPIIPLYALEFGASYSLAGLIVAAAWIGTMLSDLPTGMLLPRLGYRRAMILGAGLFAVATIALGLANFTAELIVYRFIIGIGTAFWGISRLAFITQVVPPASRGRTIAAFGGITRFGAFIGPAVGGFVGTQYGLSTALIMAGILAGAAGIMGVLFARDPEPVASTHSARHFDLAVLREVANHNRRDLVAAGATNVLAQLVRAGRQIAIPLYGASIGLDAAQIGQIVSLSSMVDMSLFAAAGYVMDRYGRKAAAVPSFVIMAIGLAMVPFAQTYFVFLIAGLVIGLGNGIGSGTMMTLGADLSPPGRTGEFLGLWRMIGDSGQAVAPLVVGSVADLVGIGLTTGMVAGTGMLAAATMALFLQETRWPDRRRPPPYLRFVRRVSE